MNSAVVDPSRRRLVVLELLKPITWFPPMWALGCGIVSSGVSPGQRWPLIVAGVLLAGPMVCGTSQAVNDWYDRHVDAINEPEPSNSVGTHSRPLGSLYRDRLDRAVAAAGDRRSAPGDLSPPSSASCWHGPTARRRSG